MALPNGWKCIIANTSGRHSLSARAITQKRMKCAEIKEMYHICRESIAFGCAKCCLPTHYVRLFAARNDLYRIGRRRDATECIGKREIKTTNALQSIETLHSFAEAQREYMVTNGENKNKSEIGPSEKPISRCETWIPIVHQLLLFILYFRCFRSNWRCVGRPIVDRFCFVAVQATSSSSDTNCILHVVHMFAGVNDSNWGMKMMEIFIAFSGKTKLVPKYATSSFARQSMQARSYQR